MSSRLKELRFRVSDEELALIKENAKQLRTLIEQRSFANLGQQKILSTI